MFKSCVFITLLTLCVSPLCAHETLELCNGSSVRFVSGELAKTLLRQNDEYIRSLTPFDLKARCGVDEGATKALYLKMLTDEVLGWTDTEKNQVKKSIDFFKPAMNQLGLKLPKIIDLIKVKDGMYRGLAYTRLSFIVFTKSCLKIDGFVKHIFPHEVFHVYSRYNRDISDELYQLIGFEDIGKLVVDDALAYRKLNNPDYVHDFYSITVDCEHGDLKGQSVRVFPLVSSESKTLTPRKPFGHYYMHGFRLLAVEKKGYHFIPMIKDGAPILIRPGSTNFNKKTRLNSPYNTGPEEIMAENFVFMLEELITKKRYATSLDVLDEMKNVIIKYKDK